MAQSTKRSRTRSRGRKRAVGRKPQGKVELRPIRTKLKAHVAKLRSAEQTPKVRNALKRLQRCLLEIQKTCGPNMSIPLG